MLVLARLFNDKHVINPLAMGHVVYAERVPLLTFLNRFTPHPTMTRQNRNTTGNTKEVIHVKRANASQ
jgi:hypothetical protein